MFRLRWLSIVSFLCLMTASCARYYSGEYPSNVYFPKEGGCRIIFGDLDINDITIYKEGGQEWYKKIMDSTHWEQDPNYRLIMTSSDWLTAKHWAKSDSIVLFVKPNTTGEKRKARIDVHHALDDFHYIYIKQDR